MKRRRTDKAGPSTAEKVLKESLVEFATCKEALDHLHKSFPANNFKELIRPVILKSQLYSLCPNRSRVDHELCTLRSNGSIRAIKLGGDVDDTVGLMISEDYAEIIREYSANQNLPEGIIDRFLQLTLKDCSSLSIQKNQILSKFKDSEITTLVHVGCLTIRESGSWWVSTPVAGSFVRSYVRGNRALVSILKRTKFKEMLLSDLLKRKLGKEAFLDIVYHVHDIVGSGVAKRIMTTSGSLIRLTS